MTHKSNVPLTLKKSRIESIAGLAEKLEAADTAFDIDDTDSYPDAWGCARGGCDVVKIFGVTFMVDFASKIIIEDPDAKPCARAPAAATSAASAADSSQKRIRHGKVDVNGVFSLFRLPSDFGREAAAAVYDETLMSSISADKALHLQSPDKVPPQSFLIFLRTLAVQIGAVAGANTAAIASTMVARKASRVESVRGANSTIHAGAPTDGQFSLDLPNKNNLILIALQRGILEIAEYAALVHKTHYSSCGYNDFIAALFESYRPDLAEVVETIQDGESVTKDLSVKLDSNVFYVLGVRLMARQKTSLSAFFRRERPRYEAAAKSAGWKPTTTTKVSTPKTPTPSKPSPATSRLHGGPKRARDRDETDPDEPAQQDRRQSDSPKGGNARRRKPRKGKGGGGNKPQSPPSTTFTTK